MGGSVLRCAEPTFGLGDASGAARLAGSTRGGCSGLGGSRTPRSGVPVRPCLHGGQFVGCGHKPSDCLGRPRHGVLVSPGDEVCICDPFRVRAGNAMRSSGPESEILDPKVLGLDPRLLGCLEPDALPTFGAAVRAKLSEAGASRERWTSWKESTGWIVKLSFMVPPAVRTNR